MGKDHPYIRGEYKILKRVQDKTGGIIPTYVGNTIQRTFRIPPNKDHPYIRGEYYYS